MPKAEPCKLSACAKYALFFLMINYGVKKDDLNEEVKQLFRILQSSETNLSDSKSVLDFIVEWKL